MFLCRFAGGVPPFFAEWGRSVRISTFLSLCLYNVTLINAPDALYETVYVRTIPQKGTRNGESSTRFAEARKGEIIALYRNILHGLHMD